MELVYLWISKYKNIENQGFNLNSKWQVEYNDQTKELKVEKRNPQPIANFFGEHISNVTAIVGENGAGKSTLLELLIWFTSFGIDNTMHRLFNEYKDIAFVFIKNIDKYNIIYSNIFDLKIITSHLYKVDIRILNILNNDTESSVYYAPFTDGYYKSFLLEEDLSRDKFNDTSATKVLYNCLEKNLNQKFITENLTKQIEFSKQIYNTENLPKIFLIPQYLSVFENIYLIDALIYQIEKNYTNNNKALLSSLGQYDNDKYFPTIINILRKINSQYNDNNIKKITKNIFLKCIYDFFMSVQMEISDREKLLSIIDSDNENKDIDILINKIYKYLSKNTSKWHKEYIDKIDKMRSFIYELSLLITITDNYLVLDVSKIDLDILTNIILEEKISKLFSDTTRVLDFDWIVKLNTPNEPLNLSTGEYFLFTMLSNIFYKFKSPNFYFIDEGDLGLHPNWQAQYLNILFDVINSLNTSKIHIIFTTHSPFVLSDLPRENVVFLEKDKSGKCQVVKNPMERPQTFASNIHTLFAEGFFMREGTIGHFAKSKIEKVLTYLSKDFDTISPEEMQEIRRIIDLIGEPIIKNKLLRMIEDRNTLTVDERINDLQAQIDELKKRK
jgi:predicted ATPase